jgi:hypothetical protein
MLHNNAHEHTISGPTESLYQLNSEVLKHPASVTCLVHLETPWEAAISPATKKLKKWGMQDWSFNQNKSVSEGVHKLVDHWTKCVDNY